MEIYPWGDDPFRAKTAFKRARERGASVAELLEGATRYRDDPNRTEGFTKLACNWLDAGGWLNGPLPAKPQSNGQKPKRDPNANIMTDRTRPGGILKDL